MRKYLYVSGKQEALAMHSIVVPLQSHTNTIVISYFLAGNSRPSSYCFCTCLFTVTSHTEHWYNMGKIWSTAGAIEQWSLVKLPANFTYLSHWAPAVRSIFVFELLLAGNARCSSYVHWKARSWLRISDIITLFSLGITAEVLRTNIDCKSLFMQGWVILAENFR